MKLLVDSFINPEIKDYLLSQKGINDVNIKEVGIDTEIEIEYDDISPIVIMKHIDLYCDNKLPVLLKFDKCLKGEKKKINYNVSDMCCDQCYRSLVMELFENKFINSVRSNFDYMLAVLNTDFEIEYINCDEEEIIKIFNKY